MISPFKRYHTLKKHLGIKIFTQLILCALGFIIILGVASTGVMYNSGYHIPPYSNGLLSKNYIDTPVFSYKFQKYIERTAEYVQYRERGYEASNTDNSKLGISNSSSIHDATVYDNQDSKMFHFYNNRLNSPTNFIYYVKNKTTGKEYFSQNYFKENNITVSQFQENIEKRSVYFVLDTNTKKYATNLSTDYYLESTDIDWIIQCITGKHTKEDSESKYQQEQAETNTDLESVGNTLSVTVPSTGDTKGSSIKSSPGSVESTLNSTASSAITAEKISNQYIIYATVDDSFQANDDFYDSASAYDFYATFYHFLPVTILLFFAFFSLSIALSGNSSKKDGIVLFGFDKIWTEFAAITTIILSFLCLLVVLYTIEYFPFIKFNLPFIIYIAVGYLLLYPIPMFGIYSLVRRIKAKTLWSNSLLCLAIKKGKHCFHAFFQNKKLTYKAAALFLLFTAANGFAFYLYWDFRNETGILLFLIISGIAYMGAGYLLLKTAVDLNHVIINTKEIAAGNLNHKIPVKHMVSSIQSVGIDINNISSGLSVAVEERLKSERFKTELITNVSHDIKTPLTSIINYVDLLKKEELNNAVAAGYLKVLEQKSWRLKTLIEDLVEASKASTGTLSLTLEKLNLVELIRQSAGEFEDRFLSRELELNLNISDEPIYIMADGRSTFRIIENIFSNAFKYALKGTRVYVDILKSSSTVTVTIKNVSSEKLNISSDELMERFVRGDLARNTEGSGLGLSIAKSLAVLQEGDFNIQLDGDLFKAIIAFNVI